MDYKIRFALSGFWKILVPNPAFEEQGKAASQKIFEILRRHRDDVAQVKISGSMVKRSTAFDSSVQEPDFDVVVFLNVAKLDDFTLPENGPPFKSILREFLHLFKRDRSITILNSHPNFISIKVDGIRLDISPAIFFKNTVHHPEATRDEKLNQTRNTLDLIEGLENPLKFGFYYTPGLTEAATDYVKNKTSRLFAHPLILLAKFWSTNLKLPSDIHYVTGRSYLIERMALYAAQELDNEKDVDHPYDLISSLEKFLQLMSVFRQMRNAEPWPIKFVFDIQEQENPGNTRNAPSPVVLDPVNPYTNLAQLHDDPALNWKIIKCFEDGAAHSLNKLRIVRWMERDGQLARFTVDKVMAVLDQSALNEAELEVKPSSTSLIAECPSEVDQVQKQPEKKLGLRIVKLAKGFGAFSIACLLIDLCLSRKKIPHVLVSSQPQSRFSSFFSQISTFLGRRK